VHGSGPANRNKRSEPKKALTRHGEIQNTKKDEVRQIDALLRFYFRIDPDELNDNDWAERWRELQYCLKREDERFKM